MYGLDITVSYGPFKLNANFKKIVLKVSLF